jgi:glutathione S-transferase
MAKVPALKDGDATLAEAAAICAYVAERYPQAKLAPPLEQIPRKASRRGFSWRRKADSIFTTESGGLDGQAVQHGFA